MRKRKKLFYIPGIISLAGIWILFFCFQKRFIHKRETYLILYVPENNNTYFDYLEGSVLSYIKRKKQIKIELDAHKEINKKKIDFVRYEARRIKYTSDTTTIINISFSNEINYGELVELINLCYQDNHKRFVLLRNSFIIIAATPPPLPDTAQHITPIYL